MAIEVGLGGTGRPDRSRVVGGECLRGEHRDQRDAEAEEPGEGGRRWSFEDGIRWRLGCLASETLALPPSHDGFALSWSSVQSLGTVSAPDAPVTQSSAIP